MSAAPLRLETQAHGLTEYPSPKQAARAAAGLGAESGDFVALRAHDDVLGAAVAPSGAFVLEAIDSRSRGVYQARSVPLDAIVEAFEQFAAGGSVRSPSLRWTRLSRWMRLPERFYDIAPRLRRGDRPLDICNDLMAETGHSKLAAAKQVEEVQTLIRAARASAFGGLLMLGLTLASIAFDSGHVLRWYSGLLYGALSLGQFAFAWYVFRESKP